MLEVFKYHLHLQTKANRRGKARQLPGLSFCKATLIPVPLNLTVTGAVPGHEEKRQHSDVGSGDEQDMQLHLQPILSADVSTSWCLTLFYVDLC